MDADTPALYPAEYFKPRIKLLTAARALFHPDADINFNPTSDTILFMSSVPFSSARPALARVVTS